MKAITSYLLLTLATFFVLQLAGKSYVGYQASRGEWIESAFSKYEFLKSRGKKTFIMVGSSTTQNQFDTRVMEKEGLSFFNMGLPGVHWQDYPFLLQDLASSPFSDTIVMHLSPLVMLRKIDCPHIDEIRKLIAFSDWHCLSHVKPLELLPFNRELPFLRVGISHPEAYRDIIAAAGEFAPPEDRIHYLRSQGPRHVFTLKEGDGVIVSPVKMHMTKGIAEDLLGKMIPEENKLYLEMLASLIKKRSRKLIIIIEPRRPMDSPNFSLEPPSGVTLIQNHKLVIHETLWADRNHLNRVGVEIYTRLVACQLKGMTDCKPLRDKLFEGI